MDGILDNTLLEEKLKGFLNREQIKKVEELIESICNQCWDSYEPCYCMRDD